MTRVKLLVLFEHASVICILFFLSYSQFKPKQGKIVIDFNSINLPGLKSSNGFEDVESS